MKVYEWTFKGRKGTVNADNAKDAKLVIAGLLRTGGDTSKRIPKGTKIKKIGLANGKDSDTPHTEAPKPAAPESTEAHKEAPCKQMHDIIYMELSKDTKFSNCVIQFSDGSKCYIGDKAELILSKGTKCCKLVTW